MASVKDYKKEYKELYQPKTTPTIVNVGEMQFIAVEGKGNPNDENGEYQQSIPILYAVQYTIKMSKMGNNAPNGYFDYVVPPLEGFWWLENNQDFSLENKSKYCWLSMIRLPEFVDYKVFEWACQEASKKKMIETQKAQFLKITEGLCVQCMHIGSYNDEPKTLKIMNDFINQQGLKSDLSEKRRHHEIYLSDPRKTDVAKLKTILRIPVISK
ncbi:MAG: GyrI-like domain-containing protein [Marinilabiliaceae bacterium]|nr:GyrI-like domain-containing protein [Marinilabiliaceae bacterium]